MPDGEEPVVGPTLESLHAECEAPKQPLLLGWRQQLQVADDDSVSVDTGVAAKGSTSDGVGRLSSELLELCEATFRSLIAQTLKSYAGRLSQFAEFCHDSENISPLEATTATVVRFSNGMADESAPSDEAASALSSGHQAQDPEEISCEQGFLYVVQYIGQLRRVTGGGDVARGIAVQRPCTRRRPAKAEPARAALACCPVGWHACPGSEPIGESRCDYDSVPTGHEVAERPHPRPRGGKHRLVLTGLDDLACLHPRLHGGGPARRGGAPAAAWTVADAL
eukprot:jgi/Tetstr1/463345/TSEL_008268.t1